jgi:hypothetical protein
LLEILTTLKTANSSRTTSAIHQLLLIGNKKLKFASNTRLELNAKLLNASGQLVKNLCQLTLASANLN